MPVATTNAGTPGAATPATATAAGAGMSPSGAPASNAAPQPALMGGGIAGAGAAPASPASPKAPSGATPKAGNGYDYAMQMVTLDKDLVIAAGTTVRVGPGTTFTASSGIKVQVEGMLVVEGTDAAPVRFLGAGMPRSWLGIVVASGGSIDLRYVEIGGATYGIHALPGSAFQVDHATLGTSFKAAVIESKGSFDHTRFHASGDQTFSPVNEVSIDDVNGTLTILDASPSVSNSTFDGSGALVDMIRVGGQSSPVFDHLYIKEAHCGIHLNGGTNTAVMITHSIFEGLSYGMMLYASKPTVQDSVFLMNGNDLGFCYDATMANAPVLERNFYSGGSAGIDASCFQIGADEPHPAAMADPTAGPTGL